MSPIHQIVPKIELFKGLQVLVVDNNRDSCHLYAVLLRRLGAIVTTTSSIEEALNVLSWLLPNVLICEMRFVGESIDTLTTKLSELELKSGNHIPTIAITTWVTDSFAQILNANFEGYLLKPIDLDQLVSMIRTSTLASRSSLPSYRVGVKLKLKARHKSLLLKN